MSKSLDDYVQETLGMQQFIILRLQAQLDAANAKIAELTPSPDPPKEL